MSKQDVIDALKALAVMPNFKMQFYPPDGWMWSWNGGDRRFELVNGETDEVITYKEVL